MGLLSYLMVEASSTAELQSKCNKVMRKEEGEDGYIYVYEPLGAPFIDKDMYRMTIFLQAFSLVMLTDSEPQQQLDS